jgi:HK97 gp10 family phage protein
MALSPGSIDRSQRIAPLADVKRRLHEAIEHAVNAVANEVMIDAQKRAPVRKVFRGGKQRTRALTPAETHAEIPLRLQLATSAGKRREIAAAPAAISTRIGRRGRANAFNPYHAGFGSSFLAARREDPLTNARDVKFSTSGRPRLVHGEIVRNAEGSIIRTTGVAQALSARGRYELESGRGVYRPPGGGQATLGGRLRREIDVGPLQRGASLIKRQVVSPTSYARYVEFGTRHAAAQPYLRPALAGQREKFHKALRDQILRATKRSRSPRGFAKQTVGGKTVVVRSVPRRNDQPINMAVIDALARTVRRTGGGSI